MFLTAEKLVPDLAVPNESEINEFIAKGRNPFSKYLPYLAYDEERGIYINKDGSLGFMFLCSPLWSDSDKARRILAACIKELPEKGTLSFHFISHDYLEPHFRGYLKSKLVKGNPLIERCAESYVDFMRRCTSVVTPSGTAQGIVQEGGRENEHTRT